MKIENDKKASELPRKDRGLLSTLSAVGLTAFKLPFAIGNISKPKMSPQELEEFHALLGQLEDRFIVREHRALGPEIVIYFTDIHDQERVEQTKVRIDAVNEIFPFEVIGFEGNCGVLPRSMSEKDRAERDQVLTPKLDNVISQAELEQLGFRIYPSTELPYGQYTDFQQDGTFTAFGVESQDISLVELDILAWTMPYFGQIRSSLAQQDFHIFSIGDRWTVNTARYLSAQEWLLERYPDYPVFDPASFNSLKVENFEHELFAIHKAGTEAFNQYLWEHQAWLVKHFQWPRNEPAATNLCAHMQENGFRRAGLVFGLGHSIPCNRKYRSIQQCLGDQGLSYIVIDPVPVKIKTTKRGIEVSHE